jgi:alpha-ketoglutarate-dependent taurine dioxygenase
MYHNDKDKKKKDSSKGDGVKSQVEKHTSKKGPAKNEKEARKQMKSAAQDVIRTRQEIKRIASEPKGHFNKRVIGDPQKLSKKLRGSLYAKENKRDSLRKVVRGYEKSKLKK